MLNQVPRAVSHASRQVVLRHPNSMPCTVWRREVRRVEIDPINGLPSEMGGSPTLGGMGVMRAEDESEFDYVELGPGRMLFVGPFQPADAVERGNALVPASVTEALVECVAEPGAAEHWVAGSGDLVFLDMGLGVLMPYEAVSVAGSINIPPYTRRLGLNPRDDLAFLSPPFAGA